MSAFDLCDAREERFLRDLIRTANSRELHDHPIPELHALLLAVENMWGGHYKKPPTVSPQLVYYLAVCAAYSHHIPEDVKEWRRGAAHDVHAILQGCMESVALAIKDGSQVRRDDDGVYLDLFRIPQWFYDEVTKEWLSASAYCPDSTDRQLGRRATDEAPTLSSVYEQATEFHERATHSALRDTPYIDAIDLLLRVVIVLLDGRHSDDEYVQSRLRDAVGQLGYQLSITPEAECNQDEPCHFHRHRDRQGLLDRKPARGQAGSAAPPAAESAKEDGYRG